METLNCYRSICCALGMEMRWFSAFSFVFRSFMVGVMMLSAAEIDLYSFRWWSGRWIINLGRSGRGQSCVIWGSISVYVWRDWRKTWKTCRPRWEHGMTRVRNRIPIHTTFDILNKVIARLNNVSYLDVLATYTITCQPHESHDTNTRNCT